MRPGRDKGEDMPEVTFSLNDEFALWVLNRIGEEYENNKSVESPDFMSFEAYIVKRFDDFNLAISVCQ